MLLKSHPQETEHKSVDDADLPQHSPLPCQVSSSEEPDAAE